jgi:hypothetical protein
MVISKQRVSRELFLLYLNTGNIMNRNVRPCREFLPVGYHNLPENIQNMINQEYPLSLSHNHYNNNRLQAPPPTDPGPTPISRTPFLKIFDNILTLFDLIKDSLPSPDRVERTIVLGETSSLLFDNVKTIHFANITDVVKLFVLDPAALHLADLLPPLPQPPSPTTPQPPSPSPHLWIPTAGARASEYQKNSLIYNIPSIPLFSHLLITLSPPPHPTFSDPKVVARPPKISDMTEHHC